MKSRLLLIALGLLFICQSPLFAQDRASDASPVRVLRAALGLTEDQAVQLRQLIEEEIHSDEPAPQTHRSPGRRICLSAVILSWRWG